MGYEPLAKEALRLIRENLRSNFHPTSTSPQLVRPAPSSPLNTLTSSPTLTEYPSVFRKLSSLLLLSLLTVLVGAKDLTMGFCLCEQTLFLGKDPCAENESQCGCCSTCCQEKEEPCDDCVIPIQLEVEDYLWTSDSFAFTTPAIPLVAKAFQTIETPRPPTVVPISPSLEPPPPLNRLLLISRQRLLL